MNALACAVWMVLVSGVASTILEYDTCPLSQHRPSCSGRDLCLYNNTCNTTQEFCCDCEGGSKTCMEPATVCASTACNCNVIFLLDISGSVSGNTDKDGNSEISNLKNFTNDLIDRYYRINGKINIGVITFENHASVIAELGTDQSSLKQRVNQITPTNGYTNYHQAFTQQKTLFDKWLNNAGSPTRYINSLIVVTDGLPSVHSNGSKVSDTNTSTYANDLRKAMQAEVKLIIDNQKKELNGDRNKQLKIYTVIIASGATSEGFRFLQSVTDAAYILKTNGSNPSSQLYVDNYAPRTTVSPSGGSRLTEDANDLLNFDEFSSINKKENRHHKRSIVYETCANQPPIPVSSCEGKCKCNVFFLLDISGSVSGIKVNGTSEIDNLKTFTVDMINRYYKKAGEINVAVITFDTKAHVVAELGMDQNTVIANVNNKISATNGFTNYIDAFQKQKDMLDKRTRNGYKNTVILVTDGNPTITKNGTQVSDSLTSDWAKKMREEMWKDVKILIDQQRTSRNDTNFQVVTLRVSFTSTDSMNHLQTIGNFGMSFKNVTQRKIPLPLVFGNFSDLSNLSSKVVKEGIVRATCDGQSNILVSCTEVVVLVDMSGSLKGSTVQNIRNVLLKLFKETMNGTNAALVQFSDNRGEIISPLRTRTRDSDFSLLESEMLSMYTGGWTGYAAAFQFLTDSVLTNNSLKKLVLLISDGQPTVMADGVTFLRESEPLAMRQKLRDEVLSKKEEMVASRNVVMAALSLKGREGRDTDFLRRLCDYVGSNVDSKVIEVDSWASDSLVDDARTKIQAICSL